MMRIYYIILCVAVSYAAVAQENDFTQYNLNLPSANPAFTGMTEYLDIRSGLREGWNNFSIKNSNTYLSAYTALGNANRSGRKNNSLRISDPTLLDEIKADNKFRRRMGLGGMVSERTVGPYRSFATSANFAYHLPVSQKLNVSLGTRAGFMNQRIDFSGLQVRDDVNDTFYQSLLTANQGTQNTVTLDFGALLYSDRFYFGASTNNLVSERMNGEFLFDLNDGLRYRIQTGVYFPVSSEMTLSPAVVVTYAEGYDLRWLATLRMQYKDFLIVGGGFEPDSKISILLGAKTQNLSIGYSYDVYTSSLNNFNANTHEVVLGISLFNKYKLAPRFW
ncbi:MAG TPA: PorP/SprF family type IX secretion system membrane protein [Cyclobacteriaceae bacterium]|nr:PorP/SprF family type IX secretion system membrane protein [Cyclobacteriaceae bacterium]HNU41185.1 PorP/SprF family type IX secretion system membrane protein [Cyclobacteriaceae bacterium]